MSYFSWGILSTYHRSHQHLCDRVDQLPLFPCVRGETHQPQRRDVNNIPILIRILVIIGEMNLSPRLQQMSFSPGGTCCDRVQSET